MLLGQQADSTQFNETGSSSPSAPTSTWRCCGCGAKIYHASYGRMLSVLIRTTFTNADSRSL